MTIKVKSNVAQGVAQRLWAAEQAHPNSPELAELHDYLYKKFRASGGAYIDERDTDSIDTAQEAGATYVTFSNNTGSKGSGDPGSH